MKFPATFRFMLVWILLSSAMVFSNRAAGEQFQVLFDTNNDPTTGCTVPTVDGPFKGVESLLTTEFSGGLITGVALQECVNSATGAFGPPRQVSSGGWPVALQQGPSGEGAVETYVPISFLGIRAATLRLGFTGRDSNNQTVDAVTRGGHGFAFRLSAPFPPPPPEPIPTLNRVELMLLAALMVLTGLWVWRRHPHMRSLVLVVVFFGGAIGTALAAIVADGIITDWNGRAPLATDPSGDAVGTDLTSIYAAQEGLRLYFRADFSSNHPPTIADQAFTIAENTPNGGLVGTVSASDPDPGQTLTYAITAGNTSGALAINASTGQITVANTAALDFETTPSFGLTVEVTDDGAPALSDSATVTVNLTNINDAPSFTKGPDQTVNEDAAAQTVSPWATAISDRDGGTQTLTFNISGNTNPGLFLAGPAVSSTGVLTYTPAANAHGAATITLVLKDNGGTANGGADTSPAQIFTITVNPVNDAPSFTKGSDQTVLEDAVAQTVTGWATAISSGPADESGQTLSFNITGNTNASLFSAGLAVAANGTLTYTPAANANGTATITLVLQDNGGTANGGVDTSTAQSFTITVTPVNDAPSFTKGPDQTVNEDAGAQTVNPWATAISDGDGGTQTLTFNVTGNTNPGLFSAGPAVAVNGTLTYTPAANANGTATITLVLQDNGGTANGGADTSAPQGFTITVNAVDDPPTAVADSATLSEDAAATAINVLANDTDADGGPMAIGSVTQPANGVVVITGGGAGLTYQPSANYCNNPPGTTLDSFSYTLTPGGSTATVTVTVDCLNDAPVLDLDGTADDPGGDIDFSATFTEGGGAVAIVDAANLTVTDVDSASLASATVTITNLLDAGKETLAANVAGTSITATYAAPTLTLSGADTLANYQQVLRTLSYANSSSNPNTTARIVTCVVNDGALDSPTATSTVTIISINSAPSFTKGPDQTVLEDAGAQTVNPWATAISDGDGGTQTLTFNITGNTNASLFSAGPAVGANGTLTYTPAANANGTATITITLSDNGGTANGGVDTSTAQSFTITVTPVNDAPSFTKGPDQTVNEDAGAQTVNPWATAISDGDGGTQTLTFNVTGNTNPGLFSAGPAVSPTGVLTFTPAANANGTATITLVLQDNGGTANGGVDTSPAQTFTVTVNGVNDAPSFTKGSDQTVLEDAGPQTVTGWATGISAGPANEAGQTLTFLVTGNTNPGLFSAGPAIAANGTLTYTPAANVNGTATITITLSDNGGTANGGVDTSAAQSFTITVTPVNDPPVAQNKSGFTAQAHMTLQGINAGLLTGVTDADSGVNGCAPTFSVASITANTGGTVSNVNLAAGTFDFNPAPGFTGTATVNYTVQDNGCPLPAATSAPATISITVSGPVIWFVDGAAAAGGNGTLSQPFKTLGSVPAVDSANDRVFVYTGTYTEGLALLNGEQLIGQGATGASFDAFFVITPPAGTITRPPINGTRPTLQGTVTLESNTRVQGLNLNTGAAVGLNDAAAGISGAVVQEVNLTTTTATAVDLTNASVDFLGGGLSIASTTGTAFSATSGGTVTVQGTGNTITSTTGAALNVQNTTIGASGLNFRSISSNGGATNGILLNNTGSSGGLTVSGNGAAGTGGTIQNKAIGISLTSTLSPSFSWMQLNDFGDFAIRGTTVTNFTLNNSVISGVNGNDPVADEGSVRFVGLTGSATVSNCNISGGIEDNFKLLNSSGTLNRLTFTNTTIGPNNAVSGNDGINIEGTGSATINVTVQNSSFTSARGDLFNFVLNGNNTSDLVFTGNTLSNNHPAIATGGGGVTIVSGNNVALGATFTFNIANNSFRDALGVGILLVKSTDPGTVVGAFTNNNVGVLATANSGSLEGSAVKLQNAGMGTITVAMTGNTVRWYNNFGIEMLTGGGASAMGGAMNTTITGNTIANPGNNPATAVIAKNGVHLNGGTVLGDTYQICSGIGGAGALANSLSTSGAPNNSASGGEDIRLRQRQSTTVRLPSYGGVNNDNTAVQTFLISNNGGDGVPSAVASNTVPTGGGYVGGAACPVPP